MADKPPAGDPEEEVDGDGPVGGGFMEPPVSDGEQGPFGNAEVSQAEE